MLLLIVYNEHFLLYCVLKKLNCDDFVLFFVVIVVVVIACCFL